MFEWCGWKEGDTEPEPSARELAYPLLLLMSGAPHLMGLFLKNPAHEIVFFPFLSRNSWHFMLDFCLTRIIWQIGDWSWIINLGLCNRLQGCSRLKVFLVEFSQITLLRENSDLFPHSEKNNNKNVYIAETLISIYTHTHASQECILGFYFRVHRLSLMLITSAHASRK